jgi:hypothetical protein
MNAIQQAAQSRWTARSLSSTVTNGLHFGDNIEKAKAMPYATQIEVSDNQIGRSRNTRYRRAEFQIDIFAETDIVGQYAKSVVDAFDNSELATSGPFAMPSGIPGHIQSIRLSDGPTTEQEGDAVYRARMSFVVDYSQPQSMNPA